MSNILPAAPPLHNIWQALEQFMSKRLFKSLLFMYSHSFLLMVLFHALLLILSHQSWLLLWLIQRSCHGNKKIIWSWVLYLLRFYTCSWLSNITQYMANSWTISYIFIELTNYVTSRVFPRIKTRRWYY
jgi:hypothetical protein